MTSRFAEDTALDALAAQVRSFAPMGLAEVGSLLDEARRSPAGPATGRLVEQQLGAVFDAVLARRGSGADLMELFQEGSVAATVAVGEYATRGGAPAGLRAYVVRVVDSFLDDIIKREAAQRLADTLLLERVKLLELAAALEWMPEEVEVVEAVLRQARDAYDSEIVDFLDDIDDTDAGNTADI